MTFLYLFSLVNFEFTSHYYNSRQIHCYLSWFHFYVRQTMFHSSNGFCRGLWHLITWVDISCLSLLLTTEPQGFVLLTKGTSRVLTRDFRENIGREFGKRSGGPALFVCSCWQLGKQCSHSITCHISPYIFV